MASRAAPALQHHGPAGLSRFPSRPSRHSTANTKRRLLSSATVSGLLLHVCLPPLSTSNKACSDFSAVMLGERHAAGARRRCSSQSGAPLVAQACCRLRLSLSCSPHRRLGTDTLRGAGDTTRCALAGEESLVLVPCDQSPRPYACCRQDVACAQAHHREHPQSGTVVLEASKPCSELAVAVGSV